jgi:hypothetical protein
MKQKKASVEGEARRRHAIRRDVERGMESDMETGWRAMDVVDG